MISLEKFIEHVSNDRIDICRQESVIRDGHAWCADWWTIEMGRYFLLGEDEYRKQKSEFLEHNSLETKDEIINEFEHKKLMLKVLESHKDFSDKVLFCEVGRGLDIVLTSAIKNWSKITCYDGNNFVVEKTAQLFPEAECICENTYRYFENLMIDESTILIAHHTRIGNKEKEIIKKNSNILAIINGELL
jgi:hypothetical protein